MLKKIVSVFLSIIIITSLTGSVFAESVSDIKAKKEQAQEKKEEVQEEKSEVMQEVEKLNDSITENQYKLDDLDSQLSSLSKEISNLKVELQKTQKEYTEQEQLLQDRIEAQYEAGETTYIDVLLNSTGFSDFLSNYFLVSEVLENDSDLLTSIENQKTKIEKSKKNLEEKQRSVKTKKAEQEKIEVVLNNQKAQKQSKVNQLNAEEKKLSAQIDKYNAEIKRVEASIRAAAQRASSHYNITVSGSGVLSWPLPYRAAITSGFGGRNTGIPGASTYHRGIDIGVPIGTAVLAAADGYVVETGYSSVRGNYIMLKHGNNLYTFYQHLSSVSASSGQNVKKGTTIAHSGNTGIGSGPHLHFEVRTSANWLSAVNPLSYL